MYYSRTISCLAHENNPRLRRGLLLVAILWTLPFFVQAQTKNPYQLQSPLDLSLSLGGVIVSGASYVLSGLVTPLTPNQLGALDVASLPAIDRSTAASWRPCISEVSDWFLLGTVLSPLSLLASQKVRKDFLTHALLGGETLFVNYGITQSAKIALLRNRPLTYLASTDPHLLEIQQKRNARMSFFSGHASISASICWYTASVFETYYPHSPARPIVWVTAISLPAFIGWMRIRSGRHFPTDVITGYVVGACIGWLIPHLHKRK